MQNFNERRYLYIFRLTLSDHYSHCHREWRGTGLDMTNQKKTSDGRGIPAEGACMRRIGFGAQKAPAAEGPLGQRLESANEALRAILRKDGKGERDWEKTLAERADEAGRILGADSEMSERCRFSYISGLIEERYI